MLFLQISEDRFRAIVPNLMKAVPGEKPWTERLSSFLSDAEEWMERYLNVEPYVDGDKAVKDLAERLVCWRAFSQGIGAVDLVATPNGFAVVSNENLAPASRERVASLRHDAADMAERLAVRLSRLLRLNEPTWAKTFQGRQFRNIFADINSLWEFETGIEHPQPFTSYFRMLPLIVAAQRSIGRRWLTPALMTRWSDICYGGMIDAGPVDTEVIPLVRELAVDIIREEAPKCFPRLVREIISVFESDPDDQVSQQWLASDQAKAFYFKGYENEKNSPGFFF